MNSKYIKVEDNHLTFKDIENKCVRIKLSDIVSVSARPSGRYVGIITGIFFP